MLDIGCLSVPFEVPEHRLFNSVIFTHGDLQGASEALILDQVES